MYFLTEFNESQTINKSYLIKTFKWNTFTILSYDNFNDFNIKLMFV